MIKNLHKKLTELKRDKSAFTIIELIVIIAVLAILVLLAMPRFIGQVDKARIAQITNDIAVVERKVSEHLIGGLEISEWDSVGENELSSLESERKLYNKKGRIDSENTRESAEGSNHLAPREFVKSEAGSRLKGSFIVDEGGGVHYSEDEIEGTPPRGEISDDYEVARDDHFTWVADDSDSAPYSEMRDEYGYNLYTGGEEYVIIPEEIDGERVTNYYKMFSGDSSNTVRGVASESRYITNMNRMFEGFPSVELDVTHLDTDNVQHMSSMFYSTNIEELDITYFNTSNVINMPEMFANSNINTLELGRMELNSVESMYGMFMDTNTDKVDLAGLSAPKLNDFNQMFKGSNVTNVYMSRFKAPVGASMYGVFRDMVATSVDLSNAEISKEFVLEEGSGWVQEPDINQWFASSNIRELNVSNLKAYNITNSYGFFLSLRSDNVDASGLYIQGSPNFTEFFRWANITGEVNLTNANFPDAQDLFGMFGDISADKVNLNNLTVAEDTISSRNIQMNQAFINSTINELNMINVKLNNIEDINQMFLDANIGTINIKNLDGPNVYHMHGIFERVNADEINIDGFRVSHESGGPGNNGYAGNEVRMSNLFFQSDIGVVSIKNLDAPNSVQNHGLFKESKINKVDLVDINIGSSDWIIEQQNSDEYYSGDSYYTLNMMFADSVIGDIKFDNFKAPHMRDYHGLFKNAVVGKVDLSGLDTSGASRMPEMFQNANIESVDLSSFDTSNVETMGNMFNGSKMKELDLKSFDTSKVELMDSMFRDAAATHIDISSFRNDSLRNSSGIFANTQFEEIDLSNFDIIEVTTSILAFENANAKRVYISSQEKADRLNTYTVEEHGKPEQLMFYVK